MRQPWASPPARGVDQQCQPGIGRQFHRLEVQLQVADDGVTNLLESRPMKAHIVFRPPGAEYLTASGKFTDELGQRPVMGDCAPPLPSGASRRCRLPRAPNPRRSPAMPGPGTRSGRCSLAYVDRPTPANTTRAPYDWPPACRAWHYVPRRCVGDGVEYLLNRRAHALGGAGRFLLGAPALAAFARSYKWAVSASSSCSARERLSSTESDAPAKFPRSMRT